MELKDNPHAKSFMVFDKWHDTYVLWTNDYEEAYQKGLDILTERGLTLENMQSWNDCFNFFAVGDQRNTINIQGLSGVKGDESAKQLSYLYGYEIDFIGNPGLTQTQQRGFDDAMHRIDIQLRILSDILPERETLHYSALSKVKKHVAYLKEQYTPKDDD
jgi:hypothetical protein